MTDKEKIKEQANIDISNLRIAQEQDIITEFGRGKMEALEGIVDFIDSLQEEPVSEALEEAAKMYADNITDKIGYKLQLRRAVVYGAKWQEKQDQSTIELAEDHAMLAGMEKMKEQMMAKAVETTFNVSLPSGLYDKLWIKGCKECDKLLVIKKDEL